MGACNSCCLNRSNNEEYSQLLLDSERDAVADRTSLN